jgi:hypothetical protein
MVKCWKCGREYGEWRDQCPECGAPHLKKKRSLTPYLAIIGIVAVVILVFTLIPGIGGGVQPCPMCSPTIYPTPTPCATCQQCKVQTLPIKAVPRPGGKIDLMLLGGGDLTLTRTIDVRLNGLSVGTLSPVAGATLTIKGSDGPDLLIVVANSTCGVETVVLQKNF